MACNSLTLHSNGLVGSFSAVSERHVRCPGHLWSGRSAIVAVGRDEGRHSEVCTDRRLWSTAEVQRKAAVKDGGVLQGRSATWRRTKV